MYVILHQSHSFLATSCHSRYNVFTQNPQHLKFLLSFLILEYPLTFGICLKLFPKYLLKKFEINKFSSIKKSKAFKRVVRAHFKVQKYTFLLFLLYNHTIKYLNMLD